MLPFYLGWQATTIGVAFPAGQGRVPYILRDELAEIAAKVLTETGHENQTYQLTGAQDLSFAEVAQLLTELSGHPVAYHDLAPASFAELQQQAGVSPLVQLVRNGFAAAIKQRDFDLVYPDAARLLNRPPTPLRAYLQHVYLADMPAA